MKPYFSFIKKEFLEHWRTYKILILAAVFLLLGMMGPIIAKITPDLINSLPTNGIVITMPPPTAMDSWMQFFQNMGQLGLIVIVIVFCGIMATELNKGTLTNILTKGMRRGTVILSKLTVATLLWILSYLLALAVCYAYTAYFWPMGNLHNVFIAFFSMWLYGELLITLVILGGILFKNIYGSLLTAGGAVVVMSLINIAPKLQKYNPINLGGNNTPLLQAQKSVSDVAPAIYVCTALIIVVMAASIVIFNKKQL